MTTWQLSLHSHRLPTCGHLPCLMHQPSPFRSNPLCFLSLFILPLLTSLPSLSHSSSFLIPPLPVFPRTHIFIEPSRPWTSTHCNNVIRQGDCGDKVCVKVWDIALTKQSGPLSLAAHALMCKPLMNSAKERSWCHKGDKVVCVWVCVPMLAFKLSFITGWQEEWEVSRQTGRLYQGQPWGVMWLPRPNWGWHCVDAACFPQEISTQWLSDTTYPTAHTMISMVNKSPEILSFPTKLSGPCVHSHCLSTANAFSSAAGRLQKEEEAHNK